MAAYSNRSRRLRQINRIRNQFAQSDHLPFANLLPTTREPFRTCLRDSRLADFIDAKKSTPATPKKDAQTNKDQSFGLLLAQGFMLRMKAAGWKLFCARVGISPFGRWQHLPGFERLQRELKIVEGTPDRSGAAYTPTGMARWLNTVRPTDDPEVTEANIMTAERCADGLDVAFQECARWWGGPCSKANDRPK